MDNITKIDQIHDLMPSHYNTRTNPNWSALIAAIGGSDQALVNLMVELKKQFFLKTSYRPYLDNLAANSGILRPAGIGINDTTFKQYVPILAYQPKQVKLIIDQLLNIFYAKETTTAFVAAGQPEPYNLADGWELEYTVDGIYDELIKFHTADFTSISAATALEVAAAINRQATHSFAESYFDNTKKAFFVKIFTNTIGSKGSIQVVGGRANIALQLNGFVTTAGNGSNTQWLVTKVGNLMTFHWTGTGTNPMLNQLQVGDVLICLLAGNVGSFPITNIDLGTNSFSFLNLFGTAGTFTQVNSNQTKFFTPHKYVMFTQDVRAATWEVTPGEVIVELPTTPTIVQRNLIGGMHLNGSESTTTSINSSTSLTVADASSFPMAGTFWLQPVEEIQTRYITPSENTLSSTTFNGRFQGRPQEYTYTSRLALATTGDTTAGSKVISNLASVAGLAKGQSVFMPGVPSYALIVSVGVNSVTITYPATANGVTIPVQFGGNVLTGITPNLPALAFLDEHTLSSLTRTGNVVTATTSTPHDYQVGETVSIYGTSGILGQTVTGTVALNQDTITSVSSVVGVGEGELVIGTFVPLGTTITNIVGSTVTMSQNATGSATESITFNENLNGAFVITSVTSNTFTYNLTGLNGTASTPGTARVDSIGAAPSGQLVLITGAQPSSFTRITGTYVWDLTAPFVLSENTATLVDGITAGQTVPLLNVSPNTIPSTGGFVVFDYGLNTQEGPVSYLYTPNDTIIVVDPSYIFQHDHAIGSSVISIDNKGPHVMSGLGTEYPPYITNPGQARAILENLITSVASSGIFIDFLVRYPQQLYGTIAVYQVVN